MIESCLRMSLLLLRRFLRSFWMFFFFFSIRRRHTICALVTGVQTCALPILAVSRSDRIAVGGRPRELARRGEHDRIRIGADVARAARGVHPPPVMMEADTCEVAAEAAEGVRIGGADPPEPLERDS